MTPAEHHVNQATRNFQFLESINSAVNDCLDWQVTVCFYTALHFVNAHLADFGMKYITHHDVNEAINPVNALSATKIPTDAYAAYKALSNLSRRSRYLVTFKGDKVDMTAPAAMTYDKHQARALSHLSDIIKFFAETYNIEISPILIRCAELRQSEDLPYYKLVV